MSTEATGENGSVQGARLEYLTAVDFEHLPTTEALSVLGQVIDLAGDLGRVDGIDLGLSWADSLVKRPLSSAEDMTLQYFKGGAWHEKYAAAVRIGLRDNKDWSQPELKNAVLAFRSVVANESFGEWPSIRRAQLYTNLGNALSTLGRSLEAIACRDRAVSIVPGFGMALGTRAETIDAFRGVLYRSQDVRAYLTAAIEGFAAAAAPEAKYESPDYDTIIERWSKRRDELRAWLVEHPAAASPLVTIDPNTLDGDYRRWCFEKRLVLNALNDLGQMNEAAIRDDLHLPPIAPHDARAELLFGYLDTMKQEVCSARWSLYEAMTTQSRHESDGLTHHDTGDEPQHGLWIERMKSTYRAAYSIFDKIALFVNVYFEVGMDVGDVTFSKIWGKRPTDVRPVFAASGNWALRGLYWISRDLGERLFKDVMEPDARGMAELRNYIEHRFVRVVARYGPSGKGAQGLLYTVTLSDFRRRTLTVLRLAREALVMLVSAVYVEERRRGPERGAWTALPRL